MKRYICMLLALVMCISVFAMVVSAYEPYTYEYELGDLDNSSDITASDALQALQNAVGKIKLSYAQEDAADVNLDWIVDASDALKILQASVGKITLELPENPYEAYTLNEVDASCLGENVLYVINTKGLKDENTTRNYDIIRLIVCIQGLVNRNTHTNHVAIALNMDGSDQFWLDFMSESGATYEGYKQVVLSSYDSVIDTFLPFIKKCGIVAWDANVPSTANVASTICGLDNYLPVLYSTEETSLFYKLVYGKRVPVAINLVGKFTGEEGTKIADTDIDSTGSAKNDAYLWAIEKYMDRCNPEHIAYTLDGAANVPSNPIYSAGANAASAQECGIPNHDYFIMKQMFFMDLTSWSGEPASDDPDQPLGTDHDTLVKILTKRYEMAQGNFGIVQGFIPWHQKYTNRRQPSNNIEAPRLEWHFVETCGCYNCGIEADAAGPQYMSNGSLYANYEMRYEFTGNAEAKDITYDADTWYYCMVYSGDFDSSCWLKARALTVWNPDILGKVYSTYNYSTTHIMRIPQIYDYIASVKTDYEYFTGGEGAAYVMTSALFQGFVGKEDRPETRTLIDGDRAYIHYLKPYYDKENLTICGMIIDGFTKATFKTLRCLKEISTDGGYLYGTNAVSQLQNVDGVPFISRSTNVSGGSTSYEDIAPFYSTLSRNKSTGFTAFGILNNGTNYGTADQVKGVIDAFEDYCAVKKPNTKIQYVDLTTFFKLMKESKLGYVEESK